MNDAIIKYPRTHHIEGSRAQPGDDDLNWVALTELGQHLVVIEEKLDGANAGIGFTPSGELRLQSRGHYLTGGYRERHFDLFKTWAATHSSALWERLGDRYVVYGEWLYAKHTVFYDRLPHYFLEFDILDRETGIFLSTQKRHQLLAASPIISVPIVWRGHQPTRSLLDSLIGPSLYKSLSWREKLTALTTSANLDPQRIGAETDPSSRMEGLYLKVENDDEVIGRYKFVRASFLTSVIDSGSHWIDRPIVPNQLAPDIDIFAPSTQQRGEQER